MEDFVSFDLAKKLKEKGFREECLAFYTSEYTLYNNEIALCDDKYLEIAKIDYNEFLVSHNSKRENKFNNICDAPTISQVLKWLREEKRIVFGITPMQEMDCDYLGWCITIYKVADDGYGLSWQEELYYDSYESAVIAGIEYVLDNLI